MGAKIKTNAIRLLDTHKIEYEVFTYESNDGHIDGVAVAEKLNQNPKQVFKTLVTQGKSKEFYVFAIPVAEELDLKKAEGITGEKKIELIATKDLLKITGYIRGGCSPLGMKKQFKTFIHESALEFQQFIFSGGKIGIQIKMNPKDLEGIIPLGFEDLTRE